MTRQLPESIRGPVAVLGSVVTLTTYAFGAILAESVKWIHEEGRFLLSWARMRRQVALMDRKDRVPS